MASTSLQNTGFNSDIRNHCSLLPLEGEMCIDFTLATFLFLSSLNS